MAQRAAHSHAFGIRAPRIHIHSEGTCVASAGGHYYGGSVSADPWTSVIYTSDADGASTGSASVDTGVSSAEVSGRAMIVHAYDGSRIGCAILGAATALTLTASGFVPYYTYSGDLAASGTVGPMTTVGSTQTFHYQLSGVDPACSSGAGSAANSCGCACLLAPPITLTSTHSDTQWHGSTSGSLPSASMHPGFTFTREARASATRAGTTMAAR